ncbi:hypothetical protein [Pseudoduganella sp. GCM10020061]|uniref:hypothetical protein n=1 Tax=Pseudoduganella sp. GCM10020061 TaxID=3317345 RepID=UPI003628A2CD
MKRSSLRVILLSLVLLFSQQMAMLHALGHWRAGTNMVAGAQDGAGTAGKKALADSTSCAHCSTFAQFGFALGTPWHTRFDSDAVAARNALPDTPVACLRTVCSFRSRAPPQVLAS